MKKNREGYCTVPNNCIVVSEYFVCVYLVVTTRNVCEDILAATSCDNVDSDLDDQNEPIEMEQV